MSEKVWSPDLGKLAERHFGRRKIEPSPDELRAFYLEAQKHLVYPILWFGAVGSAELDSAAGLRIIQANGEGGPERPPFYCAAGVA